MPIKLQEKTISVSAAHTGLIFTCSLMKVVVQEIKMKNKPQFLRAVTFYLPDSIAYFCYFLMCSRAWMYTCNRTKTKLK